MAEVDARLLGRPPKFDGSEAAWQDWVFQTRAYLEMVHDSLGGHLDQVEMNINRPVDMNRLTAKTAANSMKVFYIWAMLLHGPLLLLLKKWTGAMA